MEKLPLLSGWSRGHNRKGNLVESVTVLILWTIFLAKILDLTAKTPRPRNPAATLLPSLNKRWWVFYELV